MKKAGIFVHSRWGAARRLANEVAAFLSARSVEVWQVSDWDDTSLAERMDGTELLICLGGDGTMLRAARTVVPHAIPILGVNMGRLGFLAELRPDELIARLPEVLEGQCRIEERSMLQAQVRSWEVSYNALNDVVIGRASVGRPIYVEISIDGSRRAMHRCDAIIVATATGSTAYSLSAGGPILHPESRDLVLTPVAPHLGTARPMVLPPETVIDLTVSADQEAIISVDGQIDRSLLSSDPVSVCRSPHVARFVRFATPDDHYRLLSERLDWLRVLQASENPELIDMKRAMTPTWG